MVEEQARLWTDLSDIYGNFPRSVRKSCRVAMGLRDYMWTESWISDNVSRVRETVMATLSNWRSSHTMT